MSEELMNLPKSWSPAKLGECLCLINGRAYLRHELLDQGTPIIRIQNLNGGDKWFYSDLELDENKYCDKGDLLFAWSATFGPFIWQGSRSIYHYHIWKIQPFEVIDQKFAYYLLEEITQEVKAAAHGVAMPHMTKQGMENWEVALPPLNEQKRIVAKIEELRERSQKAREALSAIPELCDKFRQSVLAAAFRGDLTADWREQNTSHVSSDWHLKLLESVRTSLPLTKRQGRLWGSGTFTEDIDESWDEIPATWNWVRVIDLGYNPDLVVQIGPMSMKSNEFSEEGNIVLNVGCVQWHGLELEKCNYLPYEKAADFERYRVKANDILFTRSGAVGRSAIVPLELDGALITFHLLRVRTALDICLPKYLYYAFRGCLAVRSQIDDSAIGATRAGFNTKLLQNIWIPLPPVIEQEQILQEIENRFNITSLVEEQLHSTQAYVEKLDRSILAKAFRGELVEQDPNDESASVLLERIRAEREQQTQGETKKPGKRGQRTIKPE